MSLHLYQRAAHPAEEDLVFDLRPNQWLRAQTLRRIRWLAVGGQFIALIGAYALLPLEFPLIPCLLVVMASVWVNVLSSVCLPKNARLTERGAMWSMVFDAFQLAALLALTGGLNNPFTMLFIAPLVVAAAALSARSVGIVGGVIILCACALAFYYVPLAGVDGQTYELRPLLRFGIWIALTVSVVFIGIYVNRIAHDALSMSRALSATQLALAREQKLSALGALLAATAHELGTPLSTIALTAAELEDELGDSLDVSAAAKDDLRLIREQTRRCRDILADLSHSRAGAEETHASRQPLAAMVEEAAAPFNDMGKDIRYEFALDPALDGTGGPIIARSPAMVHGLRNLIQNAVDFANSEVRIRLSADANRVAVRIADNGPGFSDEALMKLGDPFIGSRQRSAKKPRKDADYEGMGLGIFIAKTLLERSGADVSFSNASGGERSARQARSTGAVARIVWPRARIEVSPSKPAMKSEAE